MFSLRLSACKEEWKSYKENTGNLNPCLYLLILRLHSTDPLLAGERTIIPPPPPQASWSVCLCSVLNFNRSSVVSLWANLEQSNSSLAMFGKVLSAANPEHCIEVLVMQLFYLQAYDQLSPRQ